MKQYKYDIESIKRLTKQMVILVDSREKKNSHILDYFKKQKIAYQVEKLEYGDYSFMIPAAAEGAHEKRVLLNRRQGYPIFLGRGAGNSRQE